MFRDMVIRWYNTGRIDDVGLKRALDKGWITKEDYDELTFNEG